MGSEYDRYAEVGGFDCQIPNWEKAGRVHDWRNYFNDDVRKIWNTFTPYQRFVLASQADAVASVEDWD